MDLSRILPKLRSTQIREDAERASRPNAGSPGFRGPQESPGLRRLRASRGRRRVYASLNALAILAATVLMGVINFNPGTTLMTTVLLPVLLVLVAVMLVVTTQLGRATGANSRYRRLDERQRAELNRATRIGHHVTAGLMLAVFLVFAVLEGPSPESVSFPRELFMPVLWVIIMAHTSIPALYLAWTQPDEVPDEEQF
ncbi:hypothetical protein A6A08_15335 [Nocardiopsis sp. TSRI0078]|uniref:hypothetical protein n=1 Tax=unclassified Nocardiopsis TaxID=2649073 RepID=UPI00095E5E08|nr:hypothetical protein [Nocardiopsis sp. TSRI0078]OKI13652.1 hypothetical protein A6A08_15335 [Nocardiopsis sp. TSRI0078]